MKSHFLLVAVSVSFSALTAVSQTRAQTPLVSIEMVAVGDPGNAGDPTIMSGGISNCGAVSYEFAIGKYEVTISQYTAFLNSVAASDPHGLYNIGMTTNLNIAGIARSGSSGGFTYSVMTNSGSSANRPVLYVSWFDAARFANWMHNGATNGASTETGAYNLNGATNGVIIKNANARYWIPSDDEWHKAAFYKGGGTNAGYWTYATRSDLLPGNLLDGSPNQANYRLNLRYSVTQATNLSPTQNYLTDVGAYTGSPGPYGTFDQDGNVKEWTDAVIAETNRGWRGGDWVGVSLIKATRGGNFPPTIEGNNVGFRLAAIPPAVTNWFLTLENSANLSDSWQAVEVTTNMITQDGKLSLGPLTNSNAFYRLRIEAITR